MTEGEVRPGDERQNDDLRPEASEQEHGLHHQADVVEPEAGFDLGPGVPVQRQPGDGAVGLS